MEKKKMIAVLAITVMAVPLALVGCGGGGEVIEPHNPPEIIQNIDGGADHYGSLEDELSNAGVTIITPSEEVEDETTVPEVEEEVSLLDESTAGTYYIIDEDQSVYASADESSEVVDTYTVDTEITVSGMWGDTGMFQVVDADGNVIGYVHSGYCDTIKGGYQDPALETPSTETPIETPSTETPSVTPSEPTPTPETPSTTPSEPTTPPTSEREDGFDGMTDEEIQKIMEQYGFGDYIDSGSDGGSSGGYIPPEEGGYVFGQGDYSDIPSHTVQ